MAKVKVGDWEKIFSSDEWETYGAVSVKIGKETHDVGIVVGVPPFMRGTAEAAGGPMSPYITAWYADSSDWESAVPVNDVLTKEALLEGLMGSAMKLWSTRPGEPVKGDRED